MPAQARMRRGRLFSPMYFLRQGSIYKGFLGGSRGWMAVGAVYFGGRFIRRTLGRTEEIVTTEPLQPGQLLRIEAIPMRTRAQRRQAKAESKALAALAKADPTVKHP